ncbi:MAG: hypothetical protein J0I09_07420 [Sphingobacteriia bacterium]|nr:hypothetical protein [Sphingobacteriia bacterium]
MRLLLLITTSFFTSIVLGQTKTNFKNFLVGQIPNISKFEQMNKYELQFDSIYAERIKLVDSLIKTDNVIDPAYKEKTTQELKQEIIEDMKLRSPVYRNNRSKYYFNYFKNNKIDQETLKVLKNFTYISPCDCYLSNDTIKVSMGLGGFGFWGFSVEITKDKFNSQYFVGDVETKNYKTKLNDTLGYSIVVKNDFQNLIINTKPNYTVGQNITGYLSFKTNNYYSPSDKANYDIEDKYISKNMDKLYLKGSLYFKCTVRKKRKIED